MRRIPSPQPIICEEARNPAQGGPTVKTKVRVPKCSFDIFSQMIARMGKLVDTHNFVVWVLLQWEVHHV